MLPFSSSKHKYVTFWQTQTACENTLGWNQFCYPRSAVHMEGDECCFTLQFPFSWSQQSLRTKIITHVHNHFIQDSGKVLLDGAQSCWLSLSVPTFSKPLIVQRSGFGTHSTNYTSGIVQRAYIHDHSQHISLMAGKVRLLHHFVQITGHLKPPVAKI